MVYYYKLLSPQYYYAVYRRLQIFHAKNISCAKISLYLIFVGGANHKN